MPVHLVEFIIASLILLVIPGPAVLYITARGIDQGRWAAMVSVWGVGLGEFTMAAGTAAGLSAILLSSVVAFNIVKYLGAAYLIYLGVRRLLTRDGEHGELAFKRTSHRRIFGQGYLVGLSNPKTALFFIAFLPQFVDPAHGHVGLQLLMLGALFVGLASITDSTYALLTSAIGARVKRNASRFSGARYLAGGTYIALGLLAVHASPSKS